MPSALVDAHCHLQDERLPDSLEAIIAEAAETGVQQLVCNGCWQEDWGRVAAAAARSAAVLPQFGLHPWWVARRSPDWLQRLRQALVAHPHAGLGEVCMFAYRPHRLPSTLLLCCCRALRVDLFM